MRSAHNNNTTVQKVITTSHVILKAVNVGFPYCTRSVSTCLRSAVPPMLIHCPSSCDTPTRRRFTRSLSGCSHDVENIQRPLLESIEAYFPPKPAKVSCQTHSPIAPWIQNKESIGTRLIVLSQRGPTQVYIGRISFI